MLPLEILLFLKRLSFLFSAHGAHSHLAEMAEAVDAIDDARQLGNPALVLTHNVDAESGNHGHSHDHADHGGAKKDAPSASNMNMRGVFLHVLADALGSVVVIISALIMWLTEWEYKEYVDPGKLYLHSYSKTPTIEYAA